MTFIIESDYRSLESHLERLASEPGPGTIGRLEMTLAFTFADATARVHVITGALRGSGKTASDQHGDSWEGQMTWGGPSPGFYPKPPPAHPHHEGHPAADQRARQEVVYAFYEKRRGGAHDYLDGQENYTEAFKQAIMEALRG